jgi:hypothetical protein
MFMHFIISLCIEELVIEFDIDVTQKFSQNQLYDVR